MECVETRSHTHAVMPCQWKRPPNKCAQNALSNSERNDVAIARKEPSHGGSPDEGERNQQGIGPVEPSKNNSCQQRTGRGTAYHGEEAVCQIGIQRYLLEQTEPHVPKEMLEIEVMTQRAMQRAEANSHEKQPHDATGEERRGPFCCGPQIISPPSHCFRSVSVSQETGKHPNGKDQP